MSSLFRIGVSPFTGFEASNLCMPLRTLAPLHTFVSLHTLAYLFITCHLCILRTLVYLDMPLHTFAPLRTLACLCIPSYLCIPWHCLNILLAESTKGTPGGAFFKLLLASGLLIYIPLLCLPSILAFFRDPCLDQKSNKQKFTRNVHKKSPCHSICPKLNARQPIQACPGPRTVRTGCTGSSAHDVLVLWYKDFLTDSEYLISSKTTLLVTLADPADLICCFNRYLPPYFS